MTSSAVTFLTLARSSQVGVCRLSPPLRLVVETDDSSEEYPSFKTVILGPVDAKLVQALHLNALHSDVRCILRSLSQLTESKVFGSMRNPSDLLNLGVCPDEVAEAVEMVPSGGAGSQLTCLSKLAWTKAYACCKCRLLVYGSSGIDFR